MSEMEWLKLTPDDAEYQSSAEYSNRPGFPHGMVHVLRNMQRNESDLPPLPYGHGLYLTTAELGGIPIVKALVVAHLRLLDICHFLTPSLIYKFLGDDAAVAAGLPLWPEHYTGDPSMRLDLSWAEVSAEPFKEE